MARGLWRPLDEPAMRSAFRTYKAGTGTAEDKRRSAASLMPPYSPLQSGNSHFGPLLRTRTGGYILLVVYAALGIGWNGVCFVHTAQITRASLLATATAALLWTWVRSR